MHGMEFSYYSYRCNAWLDGIDNMATLPVFVLPTTLRERLRSQVITSFDNSLNLI